MKENHHFQKFRDSSEIFIIHKKVKGYCFL